MRRLRDAADLVRFSARLLAGRRYALVPLAALLWPALHALIHALSTQAEPYAPDDAQNALIGLPLVVLAVFLGVRVIAGEMDARRLEIAYTVPGGSHRVWLGKLAAAWLLLVVALLMLAVAVFLFFTAYPPLVLLGSLQAATVYLVLAMGLATLFRSEVTGAMISTAVLGLNGVLTGFGSNQARFSPFWNPLARAEVDASLLLAWTVQNRIGFLLVIAALVLLAFMRAERRETMLG